MIYIDHRGDRLNKINPNTIRGFYININGLDIGHGDYSLLKICYTLQAKGVDTINITEIMFIEREHKSLTDSKKCFMKWIPKKRLVSALLNPTFLGTLTTNQEVLLYSH